MSLFAMAASWTGLGSRNKVGLLIWVPTYAAVNTHAVYLYVFVGLTDGLYRSSHPVPGETG
jgi:hypothetical protein